MTGDRAEKCDADIQVELELIMRQLMELSRQREFLGHKALATNRGLWKLGHSHTDKYNVKMLYIIFRCATVASATEVSEL